MTPATSVPPDTLDGARVLQFTPIDGRHRATGHTRHSVGAQPLAHVAALAIAQYDGDSGFYLFYCDAHWRVLTDTLHDSMSDAISQAEAEFTGTARTWVPLLRPEHY